jgi:iron complex outermembrane recepter protein
MKPPNASLLSVRLLASACVCLAAGLHAQSNVSRTDEGIVELPVFNVDASKDRGYRASNSVSGTRTNTPIRDIPVNIQVVTAQMIEDLLALSASKTLDYFGSVMTAQPHNIEDHNSNRGALFGVVRIRGFDSPVNLRDGIRTPDQSLSHNIERVEVIKGPAAVLYGLSDPGGIYNQVMKRPLLGRNQGRLALSYGSYATRRAALDYNWAIGDRAAFRINASSQFTDTQFYFNETYESSVYPAFTFKPFRDTSITLQYEYEHRDVGRSDNRHALRTPTPARMFEKSTTVRGAQLSLFDRTWFPEYAHISSNFSWTGPDARMTVERSTGTASVTQKIWQGFSVQGQLSHTNRNWDDVYRNASLVEAFWADFPLTAANRAPFHTQRWEERRQKNELTSGVITFNHEKEWHSPLLRRIQNNLTFGWQYFGDVHARRELTDTRDLRRRDANGNVISTTLAPSGGGGPQSADLSGGIYHEARNRWFYYFPISDDVRLLGKPSDLVLTLLPPGHGGFTVPGNTAYQKNTFSSFWLADSVKLFEERAIITAGVYHTAIKFNSGIDPAKLDTKVVDTSKTLPQFGVIFRPFRSLGVFALHSESMQPNTLRDKNFQAFQPITGIGNEVGLKFDSPTGRLSGTVSLFKIVKQNVVVFDPNEPNPNVPRGEGANVARGENTSKGFDVDLIFNLTPDWQVFLSYANMEVYNSGLAPDPRMAGFAEIGSYRHGYGLLTNYSIQRGTLKGASFGFGVNGTSDTVRESPQPALDYIQRKLKGQVDGMFFARYRTKLMGRNVSLQLNLQNLFQKEYAVGFDPKKPNAANIATEAYYYPMKRSFMLTGTLEF